MTTSDIRRARLAQLIEQKYGSQAIFVAATDESQSEVSGLLKEKSFGEKKARKIEVKCGLPIGWLDDPSMITPSTEHIRAEVSKDVLVAEQLSRILSTFLTADDEVRSQILSFIDAIDVIAERSSGSAASNGR